MTSVSELVTRMRTTQQLWEEQEPRSDWWHEQRDHAEAADLIEAQAAEIAGLHEALQTIRLEIAADHLGVLEAIENIIASTLANTPAKPCEHTFIDEGSQGCPDYICPKCDNTPTQQEGGQ